MFTLLCGTVKGVFFLNQNILLEAIDLTKSYGDRLLLSPDRLTIYEGQRVGLIGENGAGKSTLLKILSGEQTADTGTIHRFCDIGVIRQTGSTADEISSQMRSRYHTQADRSHLSGGEQTRRRIAAAFSRGVPLLFADEPTTDLDREGIVQLEKELKEFRGAILLVSHDRHLLDSICDQIWQLEDGKITVFPGNYTAWQAELQQRREHQQDEYEQYKAEKARLEASAQKMLERSQQVRKAPSRMGNSEARLHKRAATDAIFRITRAKGTLQTRIDQLEKKERPRDLPDISMDFGSQTPIVSKTAISGRSVSLKAGDRVLLNKSDFVLPTGTRTALMGPNGCGKTTLLRAIADERVLDAEVHFGGQIKRNPAVKIGWFDQDHSATLDLNKSAYDNVMASSVADASTVRTTFARLNLRGDDVFKPLNVLSGGERAKTALVKLLVSDINVLLLDEPTNHLDIFTLEALEELLSCYAGTLLFVSHDRSFVDAVADRLLYFDGATLHSFEGTPEELDRQQNADHDREALELELTTLQMRSAALISRMSAPRKGDDPLKLNEEYEALLAQIRELKSRQ